MTNKPIEKYIADQPQNVQKILKKIRLTIKKVAPKAVETISYGIPTFDLNGKHMVHFAAFKNHIGFFPTPSGTEAFKEKLPAYKWSKGSVQFLINQPIPYDAIKKITVFRAREIGKQSKIVNGVTVKYHANGKTIWSKGKIIDGKANGYWEWYRIDGSIKRSGHFDKGKPIGEWITYDSKGKKYKVTKK